MAADTSGMIEEIKSRLDIVDLIGEHVSLKRAGRNFKGVCPFHNEKTPSFMVSPDKQIFHCFGCGAGGDVVGFTMRRDNLEFREALELLARRAGVEIKRHHHGAGRSEKEELRAILGEAADYYIKCLARSEKAMRYLDKRGLTADTIKSFGLGYAPDGWHNLTGHLKSKGHKPERAIAAGLAASGKNGPYDIFRSRVMFPINDINGSTIAMGGRTMGDDEPKYLNSPETELFKKSDTLYLLDKAKQDIRNKGVSLIVEGYMDAISCHMHGIKNAVAPLGTALTPAQMLRLKRMAQSVLLVFDGDSAGVGAAMRSLMIAAEQGVSAGVLAMPKGDDPDSLLKRSGHDGFVELMKNNVSSPVAFIYKTVAESDKAGGGEREAVNEALRFVAKCGDPILRDEYLGELADISRRRELTLREALKKIPSSHDSGRQMTPSGAQKPAAAAKISRDEMLLLSACVFRPEKTADVFKAITIDDIKSDIARGIMQKMLDARPKDSKAVIALAETEEERGLIAKLQINPGFDTDEIDANLADCIAHVRGRVVEDELRGMGKKIAQSKQYQDELGQVGRLINERKKISQRA